MSHKFLQCRTRFLLAITHACTTQMLLAQQKLLCRPVPGSIIPTSLDGQLHCVLSNVSVFTEAAMYTPNMQCDLEGILCCKKICTGEHPTHPVLLYDCPSWSKVWTKSVPICSGSTSMGSCSMKTPTSNYGHAGDFFLSEVPGTLHAPSPVEFLHIPGRGSEQSPFPGEAAL